MEQLEKLYNYFKDVENLYIDCDGVILDTITIIYGMLETQKSGAEITNEEYDHFFCSIDWKKLLQKAHPINNSLEMIKKIQATNRFKKIEILTHINSIPEGLAKKEFFKRELPGISVRTIGKHVPKDEVVDPTNSILVDDFIINIVKWSDKGGIGLKFSDKNLHQKHAYHSQDDKEYKFFRIFSLEEILDVCNYKDNKGNIKQRSLKK